MRFTYDEIMKMSEGYLPFTWDNAEEVIAHLAQMIVTMAAGASQWYELSDDEYIELLQDEIEE